MKLVEIIRKQSDLHQKGANAAHGVEKCSGCPWVGWVHAEHHAEMIAEAIQRDRIIDTVEQLRRVIPPSREMLGGSVIKTIGYPGWGEIYEHNIDGTWGLLQSSATENPTVSESALQPEDVPLPAILIWESPADRLYQPVAEH